jgi:hypothetical protein
MEGIEATQSLLHLNGEPGEADAMDKQSSTSGPSTGPPATSESDTISTAAEGGLSSEAEMVSAQARNARIPEEGKDLLQ